MKIVICGVSGLLIFVTSFFAQVSPTPVINNEIRDPTSIRMRSIEFERVKRNADKPVFDESSEAASIRFAKVKEDFENIQKLEAEIIKAYTTGKQINYRKISESAAEMSKDAIRLETNLFDIQKNKAAKDTKKKKTSVRDLIIELDKNISSFTDSPIFKKTRLVELEDAEKSQIYLEAIITISEILAQEAKKMI
jgi:hypothetical protein